jgi:chromate transporter
MKALVARLFDRLHRSERLMPVDARPAGPLGELAWVFLKLGTIGFGGPAAHIALMEEEVVRRRGWLTHEKFLDLLGATQLIPGPNSTELAIHVGHERAGWPGLLVAGVCFILPAMLIVMAVAWAYVAFGKLPQAAALLYGIKPVIIAVVMQALWGLTRSALKTRLLAVVAAMALVASLSGGPELGILFGAGAVIALVHWLRDQPPPDGGMAGVVMVLGPLAAGPATAAPLVPFGLWPMFGFFLKVGSVLFGSGYVLLAFLRTDLVERFGWLTEGQLLDAVAVGQITPGPVFTTATFIGYVLGGPVGAIVATIGIFLPAFFFVAVSGPLVPRLRQSPVAGAALDGVIAASLALMAVVTLHLAQAALVDFTTVVIALVSAIGLIRFKVNSAWLVVAGAVIGIGMVL